ncbi:MAG: metallopeptidase TldD-related protein, partial [Trichodesmium sp. St19_bin2]|nr:metallopeptidase TldD-related protein [Trichodesmium sp. St19_bin2]
RLLGSGTTGNGFRPDLGRYPTPELFNFIVKPGKRSLHELIGMLDDGIIVDQILGSGAGISGEFSISVELGYRVRKGEIVGRVKNTMITGNVYTALKQLVELGNDGEWNGSCYTPHVIVEGLSTISKVD